jgi:hypothetical protein
MVKLVPGYPGTRVLSSSERIIFKFDNNNCQTGARVPGYPVTLIILPDTHRQPGASIGSGNSDGLGGRRFGKGIIIITHLPPP